MKRYQCIKNVVTDGDYIDFKAGNIYEVTFISGFETLVDEYGDTWNIDENLLYHFHEILDLNVDDVPYEQYSNPMDLDTTGKSISTGCALCIAAMMTIVFIIYKIITWGS